MIEISNGTSSAVIDFADALDPDMSTWASKQIQVSNFLTPTATMQLTVRTMDDNPGHIVEAGFDKFQVIDVFPVGIKSTKLASKFTIYPNPFNSEINISIHVKEIENVRVDVLDITGRTVDKKVFTNTSRIKFNNNYKQGVYFVNIYGNGELLKTEKVIKF